LRVGSRLTGKRKPRPGLGVGPFSPKQPAARRRRWRRAHFGTTGLKALPSPQRNGATNILSSTPLPEKRRKRRGWKTSLLLAAAIAAGLSVATAAYGTDFFGLWSVGMRDREIFSPVEVEEGVFVPGTEVVDEVSMQGLTDSPEYQAAMEWEDFCSAYDPDGAILADVEGYVPPPYYEAYLCYSQ